MSEVNPTQLSSEEIFDSEDVIDEESPLSNASEDVETTEDALMRAFEETETDVEQLEKDRAELFLEPGNYYFLKGHKVSMSKMKDDRVMVNVSGMVQNIDTGKKGMFRFTVSPDKRYQKIDGKESKDSSPDMFFQGYVRVTDFFFSKFERRHKNGKELLDLLRSNNYLMYITRGQKGGNFLNQFKEM